MKLLLLRELKCLTLLFYRMRRERKLLIMKFGEMNKSKLKKMRLPNLKDKEMKSLTKE